MSNLLQFLTAQQRDADARDARRAAATEALCLALMAAHQPANSRSPSGYVPNKGYADLPPFSGAQGGPHFLRWVQLFRTRANLLGSSEQDAARVMLEAD